MKKEPLLEIPVFLILIGIFSPLAAAVDPVAYESGGRRDPFIPLLGPGGLKMTKTTTDLQVEGIIYDPPAGSLVLINGDFYKQGQTVGNATIISVLKDRVILSQDDSEKTIWMREEILPKGEKKNDTKKIPIKAH